MRVITIQHKDVLNILEQEGIYWVDQCKSSYKNYKPSYDKMMKLMEEKLGVQLLPIWCFSKVQGMEPSTDINWENYIGKGCPLDENSVLLELEVDETNALIMDYYQWTDYMFFLEGNDGDGIETALENLFKLERADTVQVCIPFIKKNMITGIYQDQYKTVTGLGGTFKPRKRRGMV